MGDDDVFDLPLSVRSVISQEAGLCDNPAACITIELALYSILAIVLEDITTVRHYKPNHLIACSRDVHDAVKSLEVIAGFPLPIDGGVGWGRWRWSIDILGPKE